MPVVTEKIHHRERKIVENIDRGDIRIKFDRIEQDGFALDHYDVRQMQVAVASTYISLSAALLQQLADARKRRQRRSLKVVDVVCGESKPRFGMPCYCLR